MSAVPQIIAYKVTGSANLKDPGSESFWSQIPWTVIPLSANVPGGGHTSQIMVKAAWNGTYLFVLLTWNVTKPSHHLSSVFSLGGGPFGYPPLWYNQSSHSFVVAPPRVDEETIVKSYYVNSTYYSQDRVAMMWYLGGQSGTPNDCMVVGAKNGGALAAGGAANIWDFMMGATWNGTQLVSPALGMKPVPEYTYYNWWNHNVSFTGVNYQAPPTGFALNLYTNASDLYEVGLGTGLFYTDVDTNHTDPFDVLAGAYNTSHTWVVEMARHMGYIPGAGQYEVNLTPGSTYDVAFAVWQGYYGENAFIKSISTFVPLVISNSSPTTTTTSITSTVNMTMIYTEVSAIVIMIVAAIILYFALRKG